MVPSTTNFILVHFGAEASAINQHLATRGLIVREVAGYGLPEYLRITVGTAEENTLLIEALEHYVKAKAA